AFETPTSAADGPPRDVPAIEIRSGTAVVHLRDDERPLTCEALQMTMVPLASDASKLQLNGELSLTEPAARFLVNGEIDLATGAVQVAITTKQVNCSQQVVAYLLRLAKIDKQDIEVGGQIDSLSLTCVVPPSSASDRTPVLQVLANCTAVHLDKPNLPAIVQDAAVTLFVDSSGPGTMRA